MVPIRLYLRNFMSYGDAGEELDFSFHLACLSGNNGDGKSALLDAITWALFGIARGLSAGGAGADDLIRSAPGVEEALVELDFRIAEQIYRVRRTRHRKRGGALEVFAWDGSDFRRLTSMTKRDTQQLLLDLLHMDYETFVTSAFLLQGQADRFTTLSPTERKRILAQILGLGRYDLLEERARERVRTAKAAARQHEQEIARLEEEAGRADECRTEIERAQAARLQAESRQAQCVEAERQAQAVVNDLLQKQQRLRQLELQYSGLMADRERIAEQASPLHKRLQAKRELIANREAVESRYRQFQEASREEQELAQKTPAYNRLVQERQALVRQVDLERQRLQSELLHLHQRLRERQEEAAQEPALAQQLALLHGRLDRLGTVRERIKVLASERSRAAMEVELLTRSNLELEQRQLELKQRLDLLYEADARCPLCETELGEPKRLQLVSRLKEAGAADAEKMRAQAARIEQARASLAALDSEHEELDAELAQVEEIQKTLGLLAQRREQARLAAEQLAHLQAQQAALAAQLDEQDFAPAPRALLAENAQATAQLGYDPDRHRQASLEARRLADAERQKVELEQALLTITEDAAALERLSALDAEKAAAAELCRQQGRELEAELGHLPQAHQDLALASEAEASGQREIQLLAQDLARWQERWDRSQQAAAQRERRVADKRQAEKEAALYSELATAFSKRGLQAIIIENVVPQLAQDANELLSRLTGGEMQVSIVTRTANRKGEEGETLDILLSDQLGTRRYELYSGGEAFRANFAVRIALSRLLAGRAGASLQTLVLDEGFGTQDSQGRERLVEAIRTVAGDFERILVITHIEELKEAFGYRVEVTKDEQGSHLAVIG